MPIQRRAMLRKQAANSAAHSSSSSSRHAKRRCALPTTDDAAIDQLMQQAAAKHNSTRQHANRLPVHTLKPPTPHTHNEERSAGAAGSTQDCGRKAAASMAACSTAMQLPCSQVAGVQLASQPAQHPKAPHSTAAQHPSRHQTHSTTDC